MHYDKPVISKDLTDLLEYCKKNSFQLIIGADSNAHSNMWGPEPKTRCKRGEALEDWILQEGLMIHNVGDAPTFENKRCQTSIDLTLSLRLTPEIKHWRVDEGFNGSDHNTIMFTIITHIDKIDPVWNWKKAEWEKFTNILKQTKIRIPQQMNERRLEYLLDKIYKKIYQAMDKTIPKIIPSGKQKPDKWFSEKLHNMRNNVTKLKRKYKRKPTNRNLMNYTEKATEYKKLCNHTREDSFKDFLETLPDIQSLSSFHKNLATLKPPQINSLIKENKTFSTPGMDTAKTLTKTHFPAQVPLMPTNYSRKQTESKNIMSADYDWITEDLIIQAMNGFQAKKSPGPDGLKPVIFPHIPKNFIKYLEFIYKGCVWFSFCLLYTSPSPRD